MRPVNLDRRRRFESLHRVLDQFELIAPGIEHVIDASRGAWALVENNWPIHNFAAAIGEILLGSFEVLDLKCDVMSAAVAIARWPSLPFRWRSY